MTRNYETLIKVIPERIKFISEETGVTLKELAGKIGVSPEHFNRAYKKGEIYKSWLDIICSQCYISSEYITGEVGNEELSLMGARRLTANGRKGLKDFIVSRGFPPETIDCLSDSQFDDIEQIIIYMATHFFPVLHVLQLFHAMFFHFSGDLDDV